MGASNYTQKGKLLVFLMIFLFFIVALVITVATGNLAVPLMMGVLFVLALLVVSEVQKASPKTKARGPTGKRTIRQPCHGPGQSLGVRLLRGFR